MPNVSTLGKAEFVTYGTGAAKQQPGSVARGLFGFCEAVNGVLIFSAAVSVQRFFTNSLGLGGTLLVSKN